MKTDDVNRLIDEAMVALEARKREWVGLTPTEFNGIKDTATTIGYAITKTEAMLKEKNT
jgi:hypothetical protein